MASKVLAGRYELFEKIGEGGMSVVYKAKDRLLNRFVAIKVLKPEFIRDKKSAPTGVATCGRLAREGH